MQDGSSSGHKGNSPRAEGSKKLTCSSQPFQGRPKAVCRAVGASAIATAGYPSPEEVAKLKQCTKQTSIEGFTATPSTLTSFLCCRKRKEVRRRGFRGDEFGAEAICTDGSTSESEMVEDDGASFIRDQSDESCVELDRCSPVRKTKVRSKSYRQISSAEDEGCSDAESVSKRSRKESYGRRSPAGLGRLEAFVKQAEAQLEEALRPSSSYHVEGYASGSECSQVSGQGKVRTLKVSKKKRGGMQCDTGSDRVAKAKRKRSRGRCPSGDRVVRVESDNFGMSGCPRVVVGTEASEGEGREVSNSEDEAETFSVGQSERGRDSEDGNSVCSGRSLDSQGPRTPVEGEGARTGIYAVGESSPGKPVVIATDRVARGQRAGSSVSDVSNQSASTIDLTAAGVRKSDGGVRPSRKVGTNMPDAVAQVAQLLTMESGGQVLGEEVNNAVSDNVSPEFRLMCQQLQIALPRANRKQANYEDWLIVCYFKGFNLEMGQGLYDDYTGVSMWNGRCMERGLIRELKDGEELVCPVYVESAMWYLCGSVERTANGIWHWQCFVQFINKMTPNQVRGFVFPNADPDDVMVVRRLGAPEQCAEYCIKPGTSYCDGSTIEEFHPVEYGILQPRKNGRSPYAWYCVKMCDRGLSEEQRGVLSSFVGEEYPKDKKLEDLRRDPKVCDYVFMHPHFCKLFADGSTEKCKAFDGQRVFYCVYGEGGIGKSGACFLAAKVLCELYGWKYYEKKCTDEWWQDYDSEEVVIIPEMDGFLKYTEFKSLIDFGRLRLPVKHSSRASNIRVILAASNRCPDEWYYGYTNETAFLRRTTCSVRFDRASDVFGRNTCQDQFVESVVRHYQANQSTLHINWLQTLDTRAKDLAARFRQSGIGAEPNQAESRAIEWGRRTEALVGFGDAGPVPRIVHAGGVGV